MAHTHEHAPEIPAVQDADEHPSQDYRTTLIVISIAIVAAIVLGIFFT